MPTQIAAYTAVAQRSAITTTAIVAAVLLPPEPQIASTKPIPSR